MFSDVHYTSERRQCALVLGECLNYFDGDVRESKKRLDEQSGPAPIAQPANDDVPLNAAIVWPEWMRVFLSAMNNLRYLVRNSAAVPVPQRWDFPVVWLAAQKTELQEPLPFQWPLSMYEQLSELIQSVAVRQNVSPLTLHRLHLKPDEPELKRFPKLSNMPLHELREHAICLQKLNELLSIALPMVSLDEHKDSWSLGAIVLRVRKLLFSVVIDRFFAQVLDATATKSCATPSIQINRVLASTFLDTNISTVLNDNKQLDLHSLCRNTILGQTRTQLLGVDLARLRPAPPSGGAPHVALNVSFIGESVLGQAGPYRAFYASLSEELQTCNGPNDTFPLRLFVPTPNNKNRIGEGRELYVPNPAAVSLQHLEMYEFTGRMIGMALRTRLFMALDFPRVVWKFLVGEKCTLQDLSQIDVNLVNSVLTPLLNCTSEEEFNELFTMHTQRDDEKEPASSVSECVFSFPITRSDNAIVEFPKYSIGNDRVPVTFSNARLYCELLQRTRLHLEMEAQLTALRDGLTRIIPKSLLLLLSWQSLEQLVCGDKEISLDLLRRHTEYGGGLTENSKRVKNMWTVLGEFTQAQRRKFIKFAYAQERLPTSDAGFTAYPRTRMLVKPSRTNANTNQDGMLPHADTCFFNIEIPDYSSLEVMRERLTTLVEIEWGMSGDDELHATFDLPSLLQPISVSPVRASASAPSAARSTTRAASSQRPSGEGDEAALGLID
jgi:hypothetical protein